MPLSTKKSSSRTISRQVFETVLLLQDLAHKMAFRNSSKSTESQLLSICVQRETSQEQ